ncbi:MAG: helix-turn-helix domain-containing protein [Propionibacteriaceae bacterium]|nr:helix-turn-helix domain-containing protein [Propionibacteriaceae bacterium]
MTQQRTQFIVACDTKLRSVRAEAGLTQEEMARAVGLSKKTVVDIEKGRRSLGWASAVCLCAVFPESQVLVSEFGGAAIDLVPSLARQVGSQSTGESASRWWIEVVANGEYLIEQNLISQHYRLLGKRRFKVGSSFDIDDLLPIFNGKHEG